MSRDDGFAVADIDSGYFDDAKVRDLWRRLHDEAKMARAVCLHQSTVLASWRQGSRVTVSQSCPLWMTADDEIVDAMKAVKLLDRSGRLPVASWTQWFQPAFERREVRRKAGRVGGQASGLSRTTDAQRLLQQTSTDAEPVRPSVPTVRPSVDDGPKRANGGQPKHDRAWRNQQRYLAYSRGQITDAQRMDMDKRDAPLSEIKA